MILRDHAGKRIFLAEDGREESLGSYAVNLMDMQMPEMNRLEAMREIRQLAGHRTPHILAMTTNAFAEDKVQCLTAGVDDFLTKPAKPQIVYATPLKWFEQHRG